MTKNNQPAKKSSKPQPPWLVVLSSMFGAVIVALQFVIGLLLVIEVIMLKKGYTNDAEMQFLGTSPIIILLGSLVLAIAVRGWLRWVWAGLALITGLVIYAWIDALSRW